MTDKIDIWMNPFILFLCSKIRVYDKKIRINLSMGTREKEGEERRGKGGEKRREKGKREKYFSGRKVTGGILSSYCVFMGV